MQRFVHDMNNKLFILSAYLECIDRDVLEANTKISVDTMISKVGECAKLVETEYAKHLAMGERMKQVLELLLKQGKIDQEVYDKLISLY